MGEAQGIHRGGGHPVKEENRIVILNLCLN